MAVIRTTIKTLARARGVACDLLAAVPREEAASSLEREREARGWERDELRRQLDQCQGDLHLMRAAAQEAANNRHANERRLVDQLQRLETALSAEQGLRARAESAALEIVALRQQLEDLRSRLQVAEADWRRLAVASRALSDALEVGGGLSTAGNIALGNLRRALGMVP